MSNCIICNNEYVKGNSRQLCCSLPCIAIKLTPSFGFPEKECCKCGTKFKPLRITTRHCSSRCKYLRDEVQCVVCEKPLPPRAAFYCSIKCRAIQRKIRRKGIEYGEIK